MKIANIAFVLGVAVWLSFISHKPCIARESRTFECAYTDSLDNCIEEALMYEDSDPPTGTDCVRRGVPTQWECWKQETRVSMVKRARYYLLNLPIGGTMFHSNGYHYNTYLKHPSNDLFIIEVIAK